MTHVASADPRRNKQIISMKLLDCWLTEAFDEITNLKQSLSSLQAEVDALKAENEDLKSLQLPAKDEKILALEQKNEEQNNRIIELEEWKKSNVVESGPSNQRALFSSFFTNKTTENEAMLLNKVRKELNESSRIENNVVISNLLKTGTNDNEIETNDTSSVNKILDILEIDREKVRRTSRIKTSNPNSNLILVEFKEKEYQTTALRNWSNVKSVEEFKNLYINKDKTKAERMAESKLRAERNRLNQELPDKDSIGRPISASEGNNNRRFYWGIRFGELKKIYKQQ
jgi:hypothetical protein